MSKPIKYKGLYDFCSNTNCKLPCALRITDRAKEEAKRQSRELSVKETCPQYTYSQTDTPVVNNVPAHDFEPFVSAK
jgi:hypothetical protein